MTQDEYTPTVRAGVLAFLIWQFWKQINVAAQWRVELNEEATMPCR